MKNTLKIMYIVLALIMASSCQRSVLKYLNLEHSPAQDNPPNTAQSTNLPELSLTNCVHVFYDKTPPAGFDSLGRIYAVNLLNLLGHFSEFQRHVSAVEDYKPGDIDKCGVNILLDTNYFSVIPEAFLNEFKNTRTQVAWVGENSFKLGSTYLKSTFGVQYHAAEPYTKLDWDHMIDNKPTFYKNVYYKGEMFYKYGDFGKREPYLDTFFAPFEISALDYNASDVVDTTDHRIIAEIEHNYTLARLPWAIQSNNRFLFTEVPLSFMHEADRYFIFSDLLFDILKAAPRHDGRYAVVRLEDVHSEVTVDSLEKARQISQLAGVTPHISIIPIFKNPLNPENARIGLPAMPMTDNADFMAEMQLFKNAGAEFIWHGITHQIGEKINPWGSDSGTDYEFWDFTHDVETNHPWPLVGRQVPGETTKTLMDRFKMGADVLASADMIPKVWLTPHYHGSALSNYVFGQIFEWNIGRVVYYENTMKGLDLDQTIDEMKFPNMSAHAWQTRYYNMKYVEVTQDTRQNGQLYPYEIYGDVYGQRLFPENLGNVNIELSTQVINLRTVDQMLEDARRNLVLRDVWGSAFYHPFLLDEPYWDDNVNDVSHNDLYKLLTGMKNLGYNFVSLEGKLADWKAPRAKKIAYHDR